MLQPFKFKKTTDNDKSLPVWTEGGILEYDINELLWLKKRANPGGKNCVESGVKIMTEQSFLNLYRPIILCRISALQGNFIYFPNHGFVWLSFT
jgi:hypothetical protein